ncbi:MAG: hypothetical protein ACOCX5_03650 [Chloroflexota bacterium]
MREQNRPGNPEQRSLDEAELRDEPEVIKRLGPEGDTAEEVMEGLEEYGYDLMDEGNFESSVTAESDQPGWMNREAKERSQINDEPEESINTDEDMT